MSISEVVIADGKNRFKTDMMGNWKVLMFGTYSPACNGIPSYRFVSIEENQVPETVKAQCNGIK